MSEELIVTVIDGFFTYAQILLLILLIGVIQGIRVASKRLRNTKLLLIPFIVTLFLSASWLTPDADVRLASRIINISLLYYTMYYYTGNLRKTVRVYALIAISTIPFALLFNWLFTTVSNLDLVYTQLYIGLVISLEYIALLFIFTKSKWDVYKRYVIIFSDKIKYILYIYIIYIYSI